MPATADDQAAYNRAFDALKASDYNGAIAQFKDFLRLYPHSALADNAQYWLGEGYYVTRDYDNAIAAFRAVGEQYPQSRKAPGCTAEARLRAVRAQAHGRCARDARPGGADAIRAPTRPSWPPSGSTKIPPDAP